MKKVVAILSVLVFLASAAFFLYTNNFKSNSITKWDENLNSDGTWLSLDNSYVSRAISIERNYGYIIDFMQKENDPIYFLTLKMEDEVTKEVREVQIPKKMNTDVIKITEDDIVAGIAGGEPVAVSVAKDLKTNDVYLDYISIIPTEE